MRPNSGWRYIPPSSSDSVQYKLELSIVLWICFRFWSYASCYWRLKKKAELAHEIQTSQYEAAALEPLALLSESQNSKITIFHNFRTLFRQKTAILAALSLGSDTNAIHRGLELTTHQFFFTINWSLSYYLDLPFSLCSKIFSIESFHFPIISKKFIDCSFNFQYP
jgi:hypothetical protein